MARVSPGPESRDGILFISSAMLPVLGMMEELSRCLNMCITVGGDGFSYVCAQVGLEVKAIVPRLPPVKTIQLNLGEEDTADGVSMVRVAVQICLGAHLPAHICLSLATSQCENKTYDPICI